MTRSSLLYDAKRFELGRAPPVLEDWTALPGLALEPDAIFPLMILICFFPTGVLEGVTACSLFETLDKDAGR